MNSHSVDQFLRLGYATIPFSGISDHIVTAITLFNELVVGGPKNLQRVCFDNEGNPTLPSDPQTDLGYFQRKGETSPDGTYDNKAVLHYAGQQRLERALATHDPGFKELITYILESNWIIFRRCQQTILEFARQLDSHFGGNGSLSSLVAQPDDKLRSLVYQEIRPGTNNIIGREHCDQSGFTLAIHESSPGLEFYINGAWQEISVPSGLAIIFAGRRLQKFRNGKIEAVRHRVRLGTTPIALNRPLRSAMVFFSNLKGVELDQSSP
jgi:hypothetical protein